MIAEFLLLLPAVYLLGGLTFAIPFVWLGVGKVDPQAADGSWGFRLLIIPGTMFFWPLLAVRWVSGVKGPPEEKNAHRKVSGAECQVSGNGQSEISMVDNLGSPTE
jgi:hypothetical protein